MTKVYITESGYKLNVASTLRMTASEAETLLDGVFEPVLGNPGTNGYVLSSTTAGVRSWVAQSGGGGGGDVDTITTTTGSSTNMLRVAAAGGLEYRTTAQVLSDIGAAPTASPTFTGTVTLPTTVASVIKPASDSTTALQLANAAGTAVLTVDTTTNLVQFHRPADTRNIKIGFASSYAGIWINESGPSTANYTFLGDGTHAYFNAPALAGSVYFRIKNTTGKARITSAGMVIGNDTNTPTAHADIAASTTAAASLRIRSGTAPTSPNAGDIWFDGTNLKMYDGTATRTISWT